MMIILFILFLGSFVLALFGIREGIDKTIKICITLLAGIRYIQTV